MSGRISIFIILIKISPGKETNITVSGVYVVSLAMEPKRIPKTTPRMVKIGSTFSRLHALLSPPVVEDLALDCIISCSQVSIGR